MQTAVALFDDNVMSRDEEAKMRSDFRRQLYSMSGKDGEFLPIAPPKLSPSDVMFLIDLWYEGKSIFSMLFPGDEGNESLFNAWRVVIPISTGNATVGPLELILDENNGEFDSFKMNEDGAIGTIYAVRLTYSKVIRVSTISKEMNSCDVCSGRDVNVGMEMLGRDLSDDVFNIEDWFESHGRYHSIGAYVTNIPSLIKSRMGTDDEMHYYYF